MSDCEIEAWIPPQRAFSSDLAGPPHPEKDGSVTALHRIWLELADWLNYQRTLLPPAVEDERVSRVRYRPRLEVYLGLSVARFKGDYNYLVKLRENWDNHVQTCERHWYIDHAVQFRQQCIMQWIDNYNQLWSPQELRELEDEQEIDRLVEKMIKQLKEARGFDKLVAPFALPHRLASRVLAKASHKLREELGFDSPFMSSLFGMPFPGMGQGDADEYEEEEDEDEEAE